MALIALNNRGGFHLDAHRGLDYAGFVYFDDFVRMDPHSQITYMGNPATAVFIGGVPVNVRETIAQVEALL